MQAQIQIPGVSVSHCPDHVYVSLRVRVAHPSQNLYFSPALMCDFAE
jgi:hypothetical protein